MLAPISLSRPCRCEKDGSLTIWDSVSYASFVLQLVSAACQHTEHQLLVSSGSRFVQWCWTNKSSTRTWAHINPICCCCHTCIERLSLKEQELWCECRQYLPGTAKPASGSKTRLRTKSAPWKRYTPTTIQTYSRHSTALQIFSSTTWTTRMKLLIHIMTYNNSILECGIVPKTSLTDRLTKTRSCTRVSDRPLGLPSAQGFGFRSAAALCSGDTKPRTAWRYICTTHAGWNIPVSKQGSYYRRRKLFSQDFEGVRYVPSARGYPISCVLNFGTFQSWNVRDAFWQIS